MQVIHILKYYFYFAVKPEIKEFNNITSVENNVAAFECRAIGDPLPELSIRKQGQDKPFDEEVIFLIFTKCDFCNV